MHTTSSKSFPTSAFPVDRPLSLILLACPPFPDFVSCARVFSFLFFIILALPRLAQLPALPSLSGPNHVVPSIHVGPPVLQAGRGASTARSLQEHLMTAVQPCCLHIKSPFPFPSLLCATGHDWNYRDLSSGLDPSESNLFPRCRKAPLSSPPLPWPQCPG